MWYEKSYDKKKHTKGRKNNQSPHIEDFVYRTELTWGMWEEFLGYW